MTPRPIKLKKLNVTVCGCELYVEADAPAEKIRAVLKTYDVTPNKKAKLPKKFNDLFNSFKK